MSRYLDALRHKGPSQLLAERWHRYYDQKFLRRWYYPRLHRKIAQNFEQMIEQRRAAHRPSAKPGVVYVAPCVDTEGPNQAALHRDWDTLDNALAVVNSRSFRMSLADDFGEPLSVSWFVVDWVGGPQSSRGLEVGHHAIFDVYAPKIGESRANGTQDELHWHYHHPLPGKIDGLNRDWNLFPVYEEVIARKILERNYFPSVYRAGNTWEDSACSTWLNRFVPFDFSNRGPYENVHFSWRTAPTEWGFYQSADGDPQAPAHHGRTMGRSLDIERGQFNEFDIERAFLAADGGTDSYVSYYTHDFQDLAKYLADGMAITRRVQARYPRVKVKHTGLTALCQGGLKQKPPGAVCWQLGRDADQLLAPTVGISITMDHDLRIQVEVEGDLFGEPFLAVALGPLAFRKELTRIKQGRFQTQLTERPTAVAAAVNTPMGMPKIVHLEQ